MSKRRWRDEHASSDLALVRESERIRRLGAAGNDIVAVRRTGERAPGELSELAIGCIEGARALLTMQRRQILDGRRSRKNPGKSAHSRKS